MLITFDRLIDRIEKDGDRFDRYLEAISELGAVATKLDRLIGSVQGVLGQDFSFGSVIDRVFWRMVTLIIIIFAAMLTTGVMYKVAVQRWARGRSVS